MIDIAHCVDHFSTKMGQGKDPDMSATLIKEEFGEWADWYHDNRYVGGIDSPKEELKELADLVYVIFGYARAKGWDLNEAIYRVHCNNLERCVWPDGSVRKREDGKVLKNPEARKVNLEDLV